ncbi:MAG: LysR family transcriptional regulator [Alphaproteobacteria bacterium]
METELARTFLTVIAAGNFIRASERLHLTQSTVSARIRLLEDQLGCRLFVRNKAGAALTPAGREFRKHASTLVRTVEQARQDVGIPHGFRAALTIGARIGLWEDLLLDWLPVMRADAPDVSIRAEIGFEPDLMQGLVEGRLDIGVMYTPESRPGLRVEPLLEERLVMVTTAAADPLVSAPPGGPGPDYVLIDWGPEFLARHNTSFPDFAAPAITSNIGWIGLRHILAAGGTGYFPERLVRPHLASGRLTRRADAPDFTLPAYVVWSPEGDAALTGFALERLRAIVEDGAPILKIRD